MNTPIASPILCCSLLFCACNGPTNTWRGELLKERSEMEKGGWSYVETLGVEGEWSTTFGGDSSTAKTIGAIWTVNGVRRNKDYTQDTDLYVIHTFVKANGDSFDVVFRKKK